MEFGPADREGLERLMTWRRDVRHFRADPIPEAVIPALRRAMDLAPSVGNSRPWRVIEVVDPGLRQRVRDLFEGANREAADAYPDERRTAYLRLKLAGLDRAPLHLAVFTRLDPEAGHGLGRRTMPATLHQSTAMAIHALWLAARAHNLGVGMVSILDPDAVERLFEVGPGQVFAGYLCIGWPEFADDTPLLHRAGWQDTTPTEWERR